MGQLHKSRLVWIVLTAAVSTLTTLVNQHVVAADIGTPILAALGGIVTGYGLVVVGSGSNVAAKGPGTVSPAAATLPSPVIVPTATVPVPQDKTPEIA
jgi:hypothetical protein